MRIKSLWIPGLVLMLLCLLSVSVYGTIQRVGEPARVRPTPTAAALPPDYVASSPDDPEALPDLIVESIHLSPSRPYVNQTVQVVVTIKNVGLKDVDPTNNFFVDFYVNPPTDDLGGLRGDYDWPVQGYALKMGESVELPPVEWTFEDVASYNLWAQVDTPTPPDFPLGDVIESDEENNIRGPKPVAVRTHYAWVQKDHVDFFQNMASTLDVVPVLGTVGIITNTPGLEINGDSALALGIFDEPPWTTWGLSPTIPPDDNMLDYNMISPDRQLNEVAENHQRFPMVHADENLVVAVWEDSQGDYPIYGKNVYLRWSDDGGETWKPALQVNETFAGHDVNDQKRPAVAVAPNGNIVVTWQDHRDDSFDIYVQVFTYAGGSLIPCHDDGDCSLACDLETEACNFRVDTDANEQDQILPDIAVDKANDFYVVWQDRRNGNDDIFMVRSYYSGTQLLWGDDTMVLDFPSTTQQASPTVSAVEGLKVTDIECNVLDPGPPPDVECTIETEEATYVVVAWEDWREGDADIYLTYSDDGGETFVVDERLNDDKLANSSNSVDQLAPAVAVNQWLKDIMLVVPYQGDDVDVEVEDVPVTSIHIAWQDFRHSTNPARDNDPDIYYNVITVEPDSNTPYPPVFTAETQEQVNENDWRAWQVGPVWQGEPDVAATGSGSTLAESVGYNAFVVWSDGRNYGGEFENLDVYLRLFSSVGAPTEFVEGNNVVVNDGARLHDFDVNKYDNYRLDMPPHARQRNPSIASTLVADWPIIQDGYIYVVWDDDRLLDPFVDRNIYQARSNLLFGGHRDVFDATSDDIPGQGERYGSGAFVSKVFDSGSPETVWYIVDWHGVTDSGTYITLQTRLGNTRQEVLDSDWYPKRFPYPDDAVSKGAPLQGYDAPGQHIEDANGDYFPQKRYIQYRVNFWARDAAEEPDVVVLNTPFLFDVILHYERPPIIYLPAVFKD